MQDNSAMGSVTRVRRHLLEVRPAGSGFLYPIIDHTLSLPADRGAPLLIALSRDERLPSLALCSDMDVPYAMGFVNALQNPLRLVHFAAAAPGDAAVPRDNFLTLSQLQALLSIAAHWCQRACVVPEAFDDATRAHAQLVLARCWASQALGALSGEPADTPVSLPAHVHRALKGATTLGHRLRMRYVASKLVQGDTRDRRSGRAAVDLAAAPTSACINQERLATLPNKAWDAMCVLLEMKDHRATYEVLAGRVGISVRRLRDYFAAAKTCNPGPLITARPGVGVLLTTEGERQARMRKSRAAAKA